MRRAATVVLIALALAGCGGDDDSDDVAATTAAATTAATTTAVTPGETQSATGCRDIEQPQPRKPPTLAAPTAVLNVEKTHLLTFKTSCGDFTVQLDPKASPKASASLLALAQRNYFDGTFFHRIVPGFVIQGGDPSGTGTGGPGYSTVDTPAAGTTYKRGVVAMAKSAAEAPGTAGSQFFVVTADDAGLPADYAIVGRVVNGGDVIARIGVLGDPNTELPTQPVVVDDVVVQVR
jgi:peptidyl-prolyl cis-trans isomerase B (cyclophilin B)